MDDLKRQGYADGNYTCICGRCGGQFIGDKRANIDNARQETRK